MVRHTAVAEAANQLAELLEAKARGLKHRRHQKTLKPARRRLEKLFRSYFHRQGAAIVLAIAPRIHSALASHPQPVREASQGGKTFAATLIPQSLHPLRFAASHADTDAYAAAIKSAINGAAETLAKEMKSGETISEDVASRYLRDNSLSKLTGDFEDTTLDRLRNAVADAWDKGGTADQIEGAIKETMADFSDFRASMVAQTEANSAYVYGRTAMANELGMEEKRWSPEGSDACPECQDQEAADWIAIDEDFPAGVDGPPLHPNCDCGLDFRQAGSGEEE